MQPTLGIFVLGFRGKNEIADKYAKKIVSRRGRKICGRIPCVCLFRLFGRRRHLFSVPMVQRAPFTNVSL
jgi:hypothetical protein